MRFAHIWVIKDERLDDWPPTGQLQLEGLVYDHFDDDSPLDVNDRLAWLRRQYATKKTQARARHRSLLARVSRPRRSCRPQVSGLFADDRSTAGAEWKHRTTKVGHTTQRRYSGQLRRARHDARTSNGACPNRPAGTDDSPVTAEKRTAAKQAKKLTPATPPPKPPRLPQKPRRRTNTQCRSTARRRRLARPGRPPLHHAAVHAIGFRLSRHRAG